LRIETSHEDDDDEDYNCNVFEIHACLAGLDLLVLKISILCGGRLWP